MGIFLTEIDGEMADDGSWWAADRDYVSAGLNALYPTHQHNQQLAKDSFFLNKTCST